MLSVKIQKKLRKNYYTIDSRRIKCLGVNSADKRLVYWKLFLKIAQRNYKRAWGRLITAGSDCNRDRVELGRGPKGSGPPLLLPTQAEAQAAETGRAGVGTDPVPAKWGHPEQILRHCSAVCQSSPWSPPLGVLPLGRSSARSGKPNWDCCSPSTSRGML